MSVFARLVFLSGLLFLLGGCLFEKPSNEGDSTLLQREVDEEGASESASESDLASPIVKEEESSVDPSILEKESFAKTMASGKKMWNLDNVSVVFTRGAEEPVTTDCASLGLVLLDGAYPKVRFSLGELTCGKGHQAEVILGELKKITKAMEYSAYHIPAYPATPNQFKLTLVDNLSLRTQLGPQRSLNALTKDHEVFFDFLATEEKQIWLNDKDHYLQIALNQSEDGQTQELSLFYSITVQTDVIKVDIKAEMVPVANP